MAAVAVGNSDKLTTQLKYYLLIHYNYQSPWITHNIIKLYVVLLNFAYYMLEDDERQEELVYLQDLLGPTPMNEEREMTLLSCINRLIRKIVRIKNKYLTKNQMVDLTDLKNATKRILIITAKLTKNELMAKLTEKELKEINELMATLTTKKLKTNTTNELNANKYNELINIKPWDIVRYVVDFLNRVNFWCDGKLQIGFSFKFDKIMTGYTELCRTSSAYVEKIMPQIAKYKPNTYVLECKRIITNYVKEINAKMIEIFTEDYFSIVLPKDNVKAFLMTKYNEQMTTDIQMIISGKLKNIVCFSPYMISDFIIGEIKRLVNRLEDGITNVMPGGNRRKTRHRKNHKARTATKSHKTRHNKTRTTSRH